MIVGHRTKERKNADHYNAQQTPLIVKSVYALLEYYTFPGRAQSISISLLRDRQALYQLTRHPRAAQGFGLVPVSRLVGSEELPFASITFSFKETVRTPPNPIPLEGLEQVRIAFHKTAQRPAGIELHHCGSMGRGLQGRAGSVL
jgi:hypothetical protein